MARTAGGDPALVALLERAWADVLRGVEEAGRLAREWPAGKEFRDCAACPEMVVVSAGSFMMGSPEGQDGRDSDEGPLHRVQISKPFAVGKNEVTLEEFARFVEETGRSMGNSCTASGDEDWKRPGFSQSYSHPVVCVNWEDAQSYAEWLSDETGTRYRLLNEAEWEYAARGGTTTSRYWGDNPSSACGNANGYDRTAEQGEDEWLRGESHACSDGHAHTSPVGTFEANGFGLHDMLGNVHEWVEDCWHDSYTGAPADESAWIGYELDFCYFGASADESAWTACGYCSNRVLRGGSWGNGPSALRSANRSGRATGFRSYFNGFRVARTLIP